MNEVESIHEAMQILNNERSELIKITILKMSYLDPECSPNVFMPVQRYKKENRSSQTEDEYFYEHRYMSPSDYRTGKGAGHEKNSGAWFREKLDMVRGRRHSKDRNRSEEKKKYRNSSPNALDLGGSNTFEQEQAIAELDMVIDYHGGTLKRNKQKELQEKNGGTWPKARAVNVLQNATGTIVTRKKQRQSVLTNFRPETGYCCSERDEPPAAQNRHSLYKSLDSNGAHFRKDFDSFEKLRNKISDYGGSRDMSNRLSILNSDNSLDYPVNKLHDKDFAGFYKKNEAGVPKYGSERDSILGHHVAVSSSHARIHSPLFHPQPRIAFPFHPHPHPHQSRDSFTFEPPYPSLHVHSPSVDASFPKRPAHHSCVVPYSPGLELGTFPRKRENARIRIPSNPSVTSKNSAGKVSTGSIERTSERGSPMPIFQVEVLSPGDGAKRNSVPDCCWGQKPLPGELRRVHIDKSNEPLGIQINCPRSGGIFVSTVSDNSLASRVGLQIGDQLLEVCGINMRNATYNLAASVLRQCGNSITMLVQYSPDSKWFWSLEMGRCTVVVFRIRRTGWFWFVFRFQLQRGRGW